MRKDTLLQKMKETVDKLNGIIHSRNLYLVVERGGNRRVFNAHVKNSDVCVTDLYTTESIPVQGNKFVDGYGEEIVL